jgi:hypothetical protein
MAWTHLSHWGMSVTILYWLPGQPDPCDWAIHFMTLRMHKMAFHSGCDMAILLKTLHIRKNVLIFFTYPLCDWAILFMALRLRKKGFRFFTLNTCFTRFVIGKFSLSHCTCAKKVYRFFTLNT